jgi:hypothetical protein
MNPLTQSKNATIPPVLFAVTLACFALSPQARATCQEGCLTNDNTVLGDDALLNNSGNDNTAIGFNALVNNTTGNDIALGNGAGRNLTTGNYNIDIGSEGLAGESRTIRIGKRGTQTTTIIAGIRDTAVTGGVAVMIDANGRLGTVTSSARFKEQIKPMDNASESILALKPVTFATGRSLTLPEPRNSAS